jgi:MFS family permease
VPRPEDDAGGRRVVAAFAAFGLWWGGWGALLPAVQRSAGVDDARLGVALLCVGAGALASMRATGWLVDRWGRAVLPAAVAALGLAGTGPGVVRGVWALSAALALLGAASGAFDVAVNAEGSRVEVARARPLLNLAHAAFSFGVIAGSALGGASRAAGVPLAGALAALGGVLAVVGAWLARGRADSADGSDGRTGRAVAAGSPPLRPWWRPPRRLAGLGALLALGFLVESAWQTWSAVHLHRDLGTSEALAATGPAVFGAAAGAGRLLAHRLVVPGREARGVVAGAAAAAAGSVAAAIAPWTGAVLAAIALAGLGTATCAPSLLGIAGRAVPADRRGAAVGTVTTVGYLGFVLAPALVGGLAGATTLPTALAAVAVAAAVLAAGAARLAPQT